MSRPREISIAATVAFVGSGLFILAGVGLGLISGFSLWAFHQKYPDLDLRDAHDPSLLLLRNILVVAVIVPILLGLVGVITAKGMLSMKPWSRISTIAWCVASTFVCLLGLAHPKLGPEIHISPTPILMLMLFLIPINAWWLMLFYRPAVVAGFGSPAAALRNDAQPGAIKLSKAKWLMISAAVIGTVLLGLASWRHYQQKALMHEIELSRDAVASAKGWHYHRIHKVAGYSLQTIDADTTCPIFQHSIVAADGPDGSPLVRESINYFGTSYVRLNGQWVQSKGRQMDNDAQGTIEIVECTKGPLGLDDNSLQYAAVIEDGSVVRGEVQNVAGETCRDYQVSVPTPDDPQEKTFQFTICINELDHFPRETRRVQPGTNEETVSRYSNWTASSDPQLPPDFSK
jgi:hypothetical protein